MSEKTSAIPLPPLVAHRGESVLLPENTLPALALGWKNKVFAVEVDVHLSADRRMVVSHDGNFRRTAGLDREIVQMTWDEISKVDVGAWKGSEFRGVRPPLLDEVFAIMPQDGKLYLEIKSPDPEFPELLADLMDRYSVRPDQIIAISFHGESLKILKSVVPEVRRSLLFWDSLKDKTAVEMMELAHSFGCVEVSGGPNSHFDEEYVRTMHDAGMKVHVWTIDDVPNAHRFALAGVDTITTNRAAWLRSHWGDVC